MLTYMGLIESVKFAIQMSEFLTNSNVRFGSKTAL